MGVWRILLFYSIISLDLIQLLKVKFNEWNKKLEDFNIFKYKIINRYKIRNLIVKVLSEEANDFIEIAVDLLNMLEDNFENIIDGFMKLTKKDIDVIMSYEYRVNKDDFVNNENSLIIGELLTLMPTQESSNIFNIFEKLSKYIPNKMSDSFNTYLCFIFTYLGNHLCRIMEKIEKNKKEKMKNEWWVY